MLTPMLQMINAGVNRALSLDPASRARLQELAGKCLALHVTGWEYPVYITSDGTRLQSGFSHAGEADARLSGTPLQLLQAVFAQTPPKGMTVEGDTHIAGAFQSVFKKLEIDWEEMLSGVFGDVVAHQIGNAVRDMRFQSQRFTQTGIEHIKDWLHESLQALPYRFEVDAFVAQVAATRGDIDRLTQRLLRLQAKLKEIGG